MTGEDLRSLGTIVAIGVSVWSLIRTFAVDKRERVRAARFAMNRIDSKLIALSASNTQLKSEWGGYFATSGQFHSGRRLAYEASVDERARLISEVEAHVAKLRRLVQSGTHIGLEDRIVKLDGLLIEAERLSDEVRREREMLKGKMDDHQSRVLDRAEGQRPGSWKPPS